MRRRENQKSYIHYRVHKSAPVDSIRSPKNRVRVLTPCIYIVMCLTEGRRYYATLLSLLRNRNNSMDTLTTAVLLRCMVTNSRKASSKLG
jgi:hypothetical protein